MLKLVWIQNARVLCLFMIELWFFQNIALSLPSIGHYIISKINMAMLFHNKDLSITARPKSVKLLNIYKALL